MKILKIGFVLIYVLNYMSVSAQQAKVYDLSQRLHVGDTFVPPSSVNLMRGKDSKIDWKALEDKVVLLDLFETSCGACIQIMPHLQELEEKHGDIFKVIIVTPEDKRVMTDFFKKNQYVKEHKVNLSVIYSDSYLRKLFPYKSIPQAVLLYKGKVQAITSSGFIDSDNILRLHKDGKIKLPLKDDFGKANLTADLSNAKEQIKAGVIFSGYQDGINSQPWKFELDSLTGLYKSSLYNMSIYGALLSLASKAKIKETYLPRRDRVVWKVKDPNRFDNFSERTTDVWLVDNGISYERYDVNVRPDSIQARIIMDDFERLYGVRAYVGKKRMPCLVLKPDEIIPYHNKTTEVMTYKGTKALSIFLDYGGNFPPAIDEIGRDDKIRLEPYENLEQLNRQLANYGMKGYIEERDIEVLIIEEIN